ncbi:hypothetical protein JCM11641_000881 [Rhodosporidiobolus odoratus]
MVKEGSYRRSEGGGRVSYDLVSLTFANTALASLAAFSSAPPWGIPVAIYGLVTVQNGLDGHGSADAGRTFVSVMGGSLFLDIVWLMSNSTHWLSCLFLILILFLKPLIIVSTLSHLRSQGHEPQFPTSVGGFSVPNVGGLTNRLPGGFPQFGNASGGAETVWAAPTASHPPHSSSYQQPRFSLDGNLEAGAGTGGTPPPSQAAGKKAASAGAEGGGYHSLD